MIIVQTDGATNKTSNKSGIGIYMKVNDTYESYAIPLVSTSNHEAEFSAVLETLKICNEKYPNEIIAFQTDSLVVVDSIEKSTTKNPLFKPLLKEILQRTHVHPHFFIKWIPSKDNVHADKLAKKAIQRHHA